MLACILALGMLRASAADQTFRQLLQTTSNCTAGSYMYESGSCAACEAGQSDADSDPATPCEACPAGRFSPAGSVTCPFVTESECRPANKVITPFTAVTQSSVGDPLEIEDLRIFQKPLKDVLPMEELEKKAEELVARRRLQGGATCFNFAELPFMPPLVR